MSLTDMAAEMEAWRQGFEHAITIARECVAHQVDEIALNDETLSAPQQSTAGGAFWRGMKTVADALEEEPARLARILMLSDPDVQVCDYCGLQTCDCDGGGR